MQLEQTQESNKLGLSYKKVAQLSYLTYEKHLTATFSAQQNHQRASYPSA